MYRELIPRLSDKYHLLAPDFPGYGYSDMPAPSQYAYTFDHLTDTTDHLLDQLGVQKYSIYIMDYGAPVGFRLATRHPEKIQAIVTQNGNAYDEGLGPFWAVYFYPLWKERNATTEAAARKLLSFDSTKYQYTEGFRNPEHVSPDAYTLDQLGLDRPGNDKVQLDLAYDYRTNPPLYPSWQKYLREKKPPVLIVWGKNDPIFIALGAKAFLRDVPNAEIHILDTGHFALEEDGAEIAAYIRVFLAKNVH
jgi:pimeloyl-ACP methyl ester carboxylesterase